MEMFGEDFDLKRDADMILKGKRGKKPPKKMSPTAPKIGSGYVEAKCSKCCKLSKVSAQAWSCEGLDSKPKCGCGGLVYLADSSSVVVCLSTTFKGKFYPANR